MNETKGDKKMNLLRKAFLPLSGVAVIALVLLVAGPRAVHAITATLVQVVNTVPVVTAPSAPLLYESNCVGAFGGTQEGSCSFQTVPAGNTLFIDAVSIYLNSLETGVGVQWSLLLTYNTGSSYPEGQGPTQGSALFVPLTKTANGFGQNYVGTITSASVWSANSPATKCQILLNGESDTGEFSCNVWGHLAPIPTT
jgi:hypothetical protein